MKNLSITKKLLLITVPALIALIVLSLIFINLTNTVNSQTRRTLYDELFVPTAALLNADRDFYQAYVAEDEIALFSARKSALEQTQALRNLVDDFSSKAVEELSLLKSQEPSAQPSQALESLITDFSKNAAAELALMKDQQTGPISSAALESLVSAFMVSMENELANFANQVTGSDAAEVLKSLVSDFSENAGQVKTRMDDAFLMIQANTDLYEVFKHPTAGVTLKQLQQAFTNDYNEWFATNTVTNSGVDAQNHFAAFDTAREHINLMTELLEAYAQNSTAVIAAQVQNTTFSSLLIVALIAVLLTGMAVFVIYYTKKNILYITGISKRIASGELKLSIDEKTFAKDEIGQLSKSMGQILERLGEYHNYIAEITSVLTTMKQGDMTIRLTQAYEGEFASVRAALLGIASSLSQTLMIINTAAEQVATGAAQVASGAQALAAGSTQQASALEQLSASTARVAHQASENSANVNAAAGYVEQASAFVRDGSEHMDKLTGAMANISNASSQIASITKVIEDIAFQTNILALNAAIEAARAGNAGKGFAVVADEVRNLAAKSAEAAKQTSDLIGHSALTVAEGTEIVTRTAKILHNVQGKDNLVSESIIKIHQASSEQAAAIEQIRQGLAQVSSVVQTNAATAEENSATSEEMSAQAAALREEVAKFILESDDEAESFAAISLRKEPVLANRPKAMEISGLGKY